VFIGTVVGPAAEHAVIIVGRKERKPYVVLTTSVIVVINIGVCRTAPHAHIAVSGASHHNVVMIKV
jgi:hypothetical protein